MKPATGEHESGGYRRSSVVASTWNWKWNFLRPSGPALPGMAYRLELTRKAAGLQSKAGGQKVRESSEVVRTAEGAEGGVPNASARPEVHLGSRALGAIFSGHCSGW